jgi:quercetin dioxygenase-like cupin family protein
MRIHFIQTLLIILVTLVIVQRPESTTNDNQPAGQHEQHSVITPEVMKWNAASKGIDAAVLSGSPSVEGSHFVLRLKMADGVKVPPHWHPIDEHLTVLSGTFYMGMGEKFNESLAKEMPAGSYGFMPKEMRHFAWCKGETIVQIHGVGPFKTIFVNDVDAKTRN